MPEDPFDLLGLPARFELEPAELERHYLARASALTLAPGGDTPESAGGWAALNDARTALADPETRANLLLARRGGPRPDQEKSLPPDFLAEMMEVRESVEAALAGGAPEEIERWRSWARHRRRDIISDLAQAFTLLPPVAGAGALKDIRVKLNAWRYVERLVEQLEA
jgi:DnaJ-domain-containing protein 1